MNATAADTELLARIASNPRPSWTRRAWARYGHPLRVRFGAFFAHVHGQPMNREAAVDTTRNVLAIIGGGTVLGNFATMRVWLMLPMALVFAAVWYVDYVRHF